MNTDIERVEMSIENANNSVDMMKAVKRLRGNKDFQFLIEDTYFRSNASRLVLLRGNMNIPAESRENIMKEIDAIGFFSSFLREIVEAGEHAASALDEYEQTLEEVRSEAVQ